MSPEEDRTRDTVDSEPKHYQRAIPDPLMMMMMIEVVLITVNSCIDDSDKYSHDMIMITIEAVMERKK